MVMLDSLLTLQRINHDGMMSVPFIHIVWRLLIVCTPFSCIYFFVFFLSFLKIIMHQLVKLTDAIWLLQLAISSSLIYALGDLSQALTRIWIRVPRLRGGRLTNWAKKIVNPEDFDFWEANCTCTWLVIMHFKYYL